MLSTPRAVCLALLFGESGPISPSRIAHLASTKWGVDVSITEAIAKHVLAELASAGCVEQSKVTGRPGRPQLRYKITKRGRIRFRKERKLMARIYMFKVKTLKTPVVPIDVVREPEPALQPNDPCTNIDDQSGQE